MNKFILFVSILVLLAGCQSSKYETIGKPALDSLIIKLKSSNPDTRLDAINSLIAAFDYNDFRIRGAAVEALGKMKDPRVVDCLISALNNPDSEVQIREKATKTLGIIKDPRAIEPLFVALNDTHSWVRGEAAKALGNFRDPRAVEPLIAALNDTNNRVRRNAAEALGLIKDPKAIGPLTAALKDKSSYVRGRAASSIKKINNPSSELDLSGKSTLELSSIWRETGNSEAMTELINYCWDNESKKDEVQIIMGNPKIKGNAQWEYVASPNSDEEILSCIIKFGKSNTITSITLKSSSGGYMEKSR